MSVGPEIATSLMIECSGRIYKALIAKIQGVKQRDVLKIRKADQMDTYPPETRKPFDTTQD